MGHMRGFFLISLPRKVGFITHNQASTRRCWDGGKCKTPGELAQSGRSSTPSDAVKHQVLMHRPQMILDFDCRPITCSIPELHPLLQSRPSGILGIFIWSKSHSSFEFVSTAVTFGLSSGSLVLGLAYKHTVVAANGDLFTSQTTWNQLMPPQVQERKRLQHPGSE